MPRVVISLRLYRMASEASTGILRVPHSVARPTAPPMSARVQPCSVDIGSMKAFIM